MLCCIVFLKLLHGKVNGTSITPLVLTIGHCTTMAKCARGISNKRGSMGGQTGELQNWGQKNEERREVTRQLRLLRDARHFEAVLTN